MDRKTKNEINQISKTLAHILETDSHEKVMVFTSSRELMELMALINRMLLDRQKIKADYKRSEISSKKMLSNISHDLKTPLTVILGYLEIMGLEHPRDEMLQKVEAKAKQVMEMINQFFTLVKLEAGDSALELRKTDITEICRENVLSFYEILIQKNFTVEISIPEHPVFVQGDPQALHRILSNLIANAIRYGIDGRYLGMELQEDAVSAYIRIIDRGKGIDRESAAHVFDRLYTMEDSRSRQIQGNGLGLTIAKSLADQMGGSLTLASQPNVQTVFTLQLKKYGHIGILERNS